MEFALLITQPGGTTGMQRGIRRELVGEAGAQLIAENGAAGWFQGETLLGRPLEEHVQLRRRGSEESVES